MLAYLVGNVDFNAAAVLCVAFIAIAFTAIAAITKFKTKAAEDHEFALGKMKIDSENQRYLYQYETDRGYKMKQLDQNLITSHRAEK